MSSCFSYRYSNFRHFSRPVLCRSAPFVRRIFITNEEDGKGWWWVDERERERQREENKREITIALRHNRFVSIELSSFCSSTVRWSRIYPLETVKNHFISSNVYRSSIESEKCHLRETFNFPLLEFVQKLTRALLSCYLILKILTLCKISVNKNRVIISFFALITRN